MDFTKPQLIGARINEKDDQLLAAHGYDHNFVINRNGADPVFAARVREPESGRVMEVHTTEPGVQFYSGNFLDGTITGRHGRVYRQRFGFCLETRTFPTRPTNAIFRPRSSNPDNFTDREQSTGSNSLRRRENKGLTPESLIPGSGVPYPR